MRFANAKDFPIKLFKVNKERKVIMKKRFAYIFINTIIITFIICGILCIDSPRSSAQYSQYPNPYSSYTGFSYSQPLTNMPYYQMSSYGTQTWPFRLGTYPYSSYPLDLYTPFTGYQLTRMLFSSFPYYNPFYSRPIQYPFFPSFYSFQPYFSTPTTRTVPNVKGLAQADAETKITDAKLTVGSITQEFSDTVQAGKVISQSPSSGQSVTQNSAVNLVISRGPQMEVALELVARGFRAPVAMASPDDASGRLFIADQIGLIRIVTSEGELLTDPFLDIRSKMVTLQESYDERGLLGLAFHPDYENNGRFFVYYSAPLRSGAPAGWNHTSRVSEFTVSTDPDVADPASEKILLRIDQPQSNNNGGQIAFSPSDGYLYIPLGDGGRANDTGTGHTSGIGNGQDITNLLGSILRIDVDSETSGLKYGIPSTNPFVGSGTLVKDIGLDEIFAFGFRNPFRISFDAEGDNDLFVSDPGQNRWEEVNIVKKGKNYGWNIKEGTHCFDPSNPDASPSSCSSTGPNGLTLTPPIIEYQNSKVAGGVGRAAIGGFVYRGSYLPDLYGKYVFGDWSTSFEQPDGTLFLATRPPKSGVLWPMGEIKVATGSDDRVNRYILSFGEDRDRELYVLASTKTGPSGKTGEVCRIVPSSGSVPFVNVYDQTIYPANKVKVAAAGYDNPGWIVIQDSSSVIIGHAPVTSGTNRDLTVTLDRNATSNEELHAMLYSDVHMVGTFEVPGPDTYVTGDRGVPVARPFIVTVSTSPTVPNVVGMVLAKAESEIAANSLDVGTVSVTHSSTVSAGVVISQSPPAGTKVTEGSSVNLLVSLGPQTTVSFFYDVQPIFNSQCIGCHVSGGQASFLSLISGLSYSNLVNKSATRTGSSAAILVKPFNSADSVLYQRISGTGLPSGEKRMPLDRSALTSQSQGTIKTWINEGAQYN